jgi:hypothetical protein
VYHNVIVVAHDRIGGDVDREDSGQFKQALLNPTASVFKTAAAVAVFTAEKSAPHAARYTMVIRGGIEGYQGVPWSGHGALRSDLLW